MKHNDEQCRKANLFDKIEDAFNEFSGNSNPVDCLAIIGEIIGLANHQEAIVARTSSHDGEVVKDCRDLIRIATKYGDDQGRMNALMIIDEKLAALSAIPKADGWQPIETAPKDGALILLANNESENVDDWWVVAGSYEKPGKRGRPNKWSAAGWYNQFQHPAAEDCSIRPTHWQPLPPAPNSQDGGRDSECN